MAVSLRGYRDRRVLITGGTGFVGSHLKRALRQAGAVVFTLDKREPPTPSNRQEFRCDIRDYTALSRVVSTVSPDIIFHLAASLDRNPNLDTIYQMIELNVVGTLNLIKAVRAVDRARSFIIAGTAEEYGINAVPFTERLKENPVTPYSFSKVCTSYLCRLSRNIYGLPTLVLRATLAYGPGQEGDMFVPSLIRSLSKDQPFEMSAGEQTRDFIYIDDLVFAYLLAGLAESVRSDVINVGLGKAYKLKYVAGLIGTLMRKRDLIRFGARPYRPCEVMRYRTSIRKAERVLGWRPRVTLHEGLKRTLEGYSAAIE